MAFLVAKVNPVLPACAGVIPIIQSGLRYNVSITRMRGGDPETPELTSIVLQYYPHARG